MKLLHLSDLHIGKRIFGLSLLEDQAFLLPQIVSAARQADVVLIAGDLYDRAAPSAEAVALCDKLLTALSDTGRPVLIISGNHDSAQRLAYASALLGRTGVHISPVYNGQVEPVVLKDQWGEVAFYLLPFLKPAFIHPMDPEAEIATTQQAVTWALARMNLDPRRRNVLLAHQFVTGAELCDGEELNVGGTEQVDAGVFAGFDYVALGHIHTPQRAGGERIRYCGSPMKFSFSEAGQEKAALLVELDGESHLRTQPIPLHPLRDMVRLRGRFQDLIGPTTRPAEDYLEITLTDEEDIPQAMARLRSVYPNLLHLRMDNRRTRERQGLQPEMTARGLSPVELLDGFYEVQNNSPLSPSQRDYAAALARQIWEEEP